VTPRTRRSGRRGDRSTTVAPTVLFFAGLGAVAVGLVVNLLPLAALGGVFVVLAALGFLVLPLLALSASVRNDRR
jgi:Flp pilus assembly protein TadB